MGRCTPTEVTGETEKTPENDQTGEKIVVAPCKCLSFDELKELIKNNNIDMPCPNHIHSSKYTVYKVPDELLMAIIAIEAPCQGNKYLTNGILSDIEFDPCALNDSSGAIGLTQITNITIEDFIDKGFLDKSTDAEIERKKICGNAALAIKYGSWNIQLKYVYARNETDLDKRLEIALNGYGGSSAYGPKCIEKMELLQANYSKETIIEYINNEK